jgi:hypothetical protein
MPLVIKVKHAGKRQLLYKREKKKEKKGALTNRREQESSQTKSVLVEAQWIPSVEKRKIGAG